MVVETIAMQISVEWQKRRQMCKFHCATTRLWKHNSPETLGASSCSVDRSVMIELVKVMLDKC